jgi:hypothetical protein
VHVGVHRHVVAAEGEQQDAGRRLATDPGQLAQLLSRLRERFVREPGEIVVADGAQDLLDPGRLGHRQASRADRFDNLLLRRVAHRVPGVEAVAETLVGHVAVAVVCVLREHGEHQLVDRGAVGMPRRAAELGCQLVENRAQATWRCGLPGHLPAGYYRHE